MLHVPRRHQIFIALLLTIALLLFFFQLLASEATPVPPLVAEQQPDRVLVPVRRPFSTPQGTIQLPSTLRRSISSYTYTEHRQFQIAVDPINLTITGKVFSDEGSTPLTGVTVAVSLNGGVAAGTDAVDNGGEYTITGLTMTGGTIVSLYIDGSASKAVTVSLASGESMTGVHLYANHLIVRSDSGSIAMTNARLNIADNNGDADISALYHVDPSNVLQVSADKELWVWAAKTLSPGGIIKTHDLEVKGTLAMGSSSLTVSGSLVTDSGIFTTSTGGTVILTSTANETLSIGSNALNNLTINNGLVGYWNFDDGNGTKARDNSGNGNIGTLTNMASGSAWTGSITSRMRFFNPTSLLFDGSDDYVQATQTGLPTGVSERSISGWIKMTSDTATVKVPFAYGNCSAGGDAFGVFLNASEVLNFWGCGSGDFSTSASVSVNTWHHITATYDRANVRVFLDGVQVGSTTAKTLNTGTVGMFIGNDGTLDPASYAFLGLVDDLRVYNRALSSSEVAALYAGSKSTGSGTYTLGTNLDVNGNFSLISGTLDTNGSNVTVARNAAIYGDFIKQAGTFTLDGTSNQTISGSTVFYNFTKTVTAATTLFFDHTARQSASGVLTIRGSQGQRLSLRSTRSGSAANLLLDADAGTQVIDYLNVQDNDASGGQRLVCDILDEGCIDSGNTTNWFFVSPSPPPPVSDDYRLRPDVIDAGGLDVSKSNSYLLSDSIGESIVGHGAATDYVLDSGYRQPSGGDFLSMTCSLGTAIGTVNGTGQKTGSGTCVIYTDASNGYSLGWAVLTGSGGVNTGSLISQYNDTISAYSPSSTNVPETWSIGGSIAEWGARLRSISTDTALEWGTDNSTDKWLNIDTMHRTIVTRASATPVDGSTEVIQFRSEVGSSAIQPTGIYQTSVTFTVVGY